MSNSREDCISMLGQRARELHKTYTAVTGNSRSAKDRKRERDRHEAELVREAQAIGILPPVLIPILWKIIYAVAVEAIKYWLNAIHEGDAK